MVRRNVTLELHNSQKWYIHYFCKTYSTRNEDWYDYTTKYAWKFMGFYGLVLIKVSFWVVLILSWRSWCTEYAKEFFLASLFPPVLLSYDHPVNRLRLVANPPIWLWSKGWKNELAYSICHCFQISLYTIPST